MLLQALAVKIREHNVMLGTASLALCLCCMLPCRMATVLSKRLKSDERLQQAHSESRHLRSVLWLTNSIALAFAVVSIGYGGYTSNTSMNWGLKHTVFYEYLLFASGIGILITSLSGMLVSRVVRKPILWFNVGLLVPLLTLLLVAASLSVKHIGNVEVEVERNCEDMSEEEQLFVIVSVKKALLISSILEFEIGAFQLLSLLCIFRLLRWLREENIEDKFSDKITWSEKMIAIWASWSGFVHIFFDGTYAIISQYMSDGTTWFTWIWRIWAHVDRRFVTADSFIAATTSMKALLSGPLCLFYAWAVYTRRADRYILGVLVCTIQLYSILLYVVTEAYDGFGDTFDRAKSHNVPLFLCFVFVNVLRLAVPIPILIHDARHAVRHTRNSERGNHIASFLSKATLSGTEEPIASTTRQSRKRSKSF